MINNTFRWPHGPVNRVVLYRWQATHTTEDLTELRIRWARLFVAPTAACSLG